MGDTGVSEQCLAEEQCLGHAQSTAGFQDRAWPSAHVGPDGRAVLGPSPRTCCMCVRTEWTVDAQGAVGRRTPGGRES